MNGFILKMITNVKRRVKNNVLNGVFAIGVYG